MNTHEPPTQQPHTTPSFTLALALGLLIIGLYALVASTSSHSVAAAGGHWYVALTGADSNDCLSPSTACQSIHAAVTKAPDGAIIDVAAGTYDENLTITKTLTIAGARADLTRIDGGRRGRVFFIHL
jgi:hypothetical protein